MGHCGVGELEVGYDAQDCVPVPVLDIRNKRLDAVYRVHRNAALALPHVKIAQINRIWKKNKIA